MINQQHKTKNITQTNNAGNITSCNSQMPYIKSMEEWLNNTIDNSNNTSNHIASSQQKHLDDWLNATMKDSPKTFSVSSTEFLDGTSKSATNTNGIGSIYAVPPQNSFRTMPDFQVN